MFIGGGLNESFRYSTEVEDSHGYKTPLLPL